MNPSANTPADESGDKDLDEQARPGHGVPSQDPDPAAQLPLDPDEAKREAASVFTGGGVVAGTATGAAIGALVAGPMGVVVGATVGGVAGALGGAAAGAAANGEETAEVRKKPA
jgi:hypothetical protein